MVQRTRRVFSPRRCQAAAPWVEQSCPCWALLAMASQQMTLMSHCLLRVVLSLKSAPFVQQLVVDCSSTMAQVQTLTRLTARLEGLTQQVLALALLVPGTTARSGARASRFEVPRASSQGVRLASLRAWGTQTLVHASSSAASTQRTRSHRDQGREQAAVRVTKVAPWAGHQAGQRVRGTAPSHLLPPAAAKCRAGEVRPVAASAQPLGEAARAWPPSLQVHMRARAHTYVSNITGRHTTAHRSNVGPPKVGHDCPKKAQGLAPQNPPPTERQPCMKSCVTQDMVWEKGRGEGSRTLHAGRERVARRHAHWQGHSSGSDRRGHRSRHATVGGGARRRGSQETLHLRGRRHGEGRAHRTRSRGCLAWRWRARCGRAGPCSSIYSGRCLCGGGLQAHHTELRGCAANAHSTQQCGHALRHHRQLT